ncbi:DUF1672 family protein [Rossellomorea vietnamensis]|uniref:DUF1672 family protein n=1 Tax=Rossellomorea vietnamensis TaxID=218284 RepID=UPI001E29453B|nr:DUF1672 family protein [Rossellomorea vietnamensis]MCC5804331.1 DUF1672 family protein [Rossellomorea vietnamensis]
MNRKNKWIIYGIGLSLLLGGCMNMDNANGNGVDEKKNTQDEVEDQSDRLVSVQEYNGEGYTLENGQENDKIAEANREEVGKAVKDFFLEKYKTDVEVHNIVGNVDGASVFVESIGKPHFHTYAVVPIDLSEKKILTDQVYSSEGEVENAISSGVYGLMYEDEFTKLNKVIEGMAEELAFTGETSEAINNTATFGYGTPYYYVSFGDIERSNLVIDTYMENPKTSKDEWKKKLNISELDPESVYITIQLFKDMQGKNPSKEELERVVKTIKDTKGIPVGAYNILLHDNTIDKETGVGSKETTIEKSLPDYIIKK